VVIDLLAGNDTSKNLLMLRSGEREKKKLAKRKRDYSYSLAGADEITLPAKGAKKKRKKQGFAL